MTIYGLDAEQHAGLGDLIFKGGVIVRKPPAKKAKRAFVPGVVRAMIVDESYPVYNPKVPRECAYFVYAPDSDTTTIEMSGDDLFGDLVVTIDGTPYTVSCQSTTDDLRWVFGFNLRDCRVTAFPGMWEFAFSGTAPWITVAAKFPASSATQFLGGVLVINEGWVSDTDGDGNYLTIPVIDAIPFLEGEIKRGARALANWSDESGWLVGQWQCRDFRFRPT